MKNLGSYTYLAPDTNGQPINVDVHLYECDECYATTTDPVRHADYHKRTETP